MSALNQRETLDKIMNIVTNMKVDDSSIQGETINEDMVDWYKERFMLFMSDGVPSAITPYMQKAQFDKNINEITRVAILHEALNCQLKK